MATRQPYVGDGSLREFDLTFPYQSPEHVKVTVDGAPVTYSWVNSSRIRLDAIPASGSSILIYRDTPIEENLVDFTDGSVLTERDLDLGQQQLLFRQQEIADSFGGDIAASVKAPDGPLKSLPLAADRALKYQTFDADGQPSVTSTALSLQPFQRDAAGAVLLSVHDRLQELSFTPEEFGAVGDGVADDTDAFVALSAAIQAAGGGEVRLRRGAVYRGGRQYTPGGSDTMWKRSRPFISVSNARSLIIHGNGATFKWLDGLRYGTFDPTTGLPQDYGAPFSDRTKAATLESAISIIDVDFFRAYDLKVDGNSDTHLVGGRFGDTGIQLQHYGIFSRRCKNFDADVEISNVFLDGLALDQSGVDFSTDTTPRPHRFSGSIVAVGRNNISTVGSNSVLVERAYLAQSGEAPNSNPGSLTVTSGKLSSAPAACFDAEAELTTNRGIVIRHSKLISGKYSNTAFVADSGDSADITVEDSELVGAVWTSKDRTIFRRCKINGKIAKLVGGRADPRNNTVIEDCVISDKDTGAWVYPPGLLFDMTGAGSTPISPVIFRRTDFTVSKSVPDARNGLFDSCAFHMQAGLGVVPDNSYVMLVNKSTLIRPVIYDEIPVGALASTAFYVSGASTAFITEGRIVPNTAQYKLRWNSSAAGYPTASRPDGTWSNITNRSAQLRINARLGWGGETSGAIMVVAHNSPPTTGYWDGEALNGLWPVGSFAFNDTPGSTKILGWVCTVAPTVPGTPGTWVAVRAIQQQAAQADSAAADVATLKADFNAFLAKARLAGIIA